MKVPLHVKRIDSARPAGALLLAGHDAAALLRICARLRLDAPPTVFTVADGYLVRFDQALPEPPVGVLRLAQIGVNLFLPVDGELVPALLPDEAGALGRNRGLVFLPHGRVLEFDPDKPLAWSDLLKPRGPVTMDWQSLPAGLPLAGTLLEITREDPATTPDELLEAGGAGIGAEQPRPDDASTAKKILGNVAGGVGQGLAWLGKLLHADGLVRAGARAMDFGLSLFPRLSEKLLGQQEASLRELLREFREGNVDNALRRALPISQDAPRGADIHGDANLPVHDLPYSLANILGNAGGRPSIWLANVNVFAELKREYRLQAEAATKRGDYRRAAFIYGKLLGDYALAADVLARGGLHQDAAQLYLKVLKNLRAAAREFELAGDVDRALQLYRQIGEHVLAGDLLRRLGDEDQAVAEYQQAADALVKTGHSYHQAGELMLHKAQRPDLAQGYFESGWARRPNGSALACARQLLDLHAAGNRSEELLNVVGEAEELFQVPGNEAGTSDFFNHLAHVACSQFASTAAAAVREDLIDRALMMLALKLRENAATSAGASRLVPQLFPAGSSWDVNQVTDAAYALKESRRPCGTPRRAGELPVARLAMLGVVSVVRAVCQAPVTDEVFLGFDSGQIGVFDPKTGKVTYLESRRLGPVHHMVCTSDADQLLVLAENPEGLFHLDCYARGLPWTLSGTRELGPMVGRPRIIHTLGMGAMGLVGVWREETGVQLLSASNLLPLQTLRVLDDAGFNEASLSFFLPAPKGKSPGYIVLDGRELWHCANLDAFSFQDPRFCSMALLPSGALSVPTVHCLQTSADIFEMVALGEGDSLVWTMFGRLGRHLDPFVTKHLTGSFRAAALVRPGWVVAVDANHLVALRASEMGLRETARQPFRLKQAEKNDQESPLACFVCHITQEVIVVGSRGSLARVRWLPG